MSMITDVTKDDRHLLKRLTAQIKEGLPQEDSPADSDDEEDGEEANYLPRRQPAAKRLKTAADPTIPVNPTGDENVDEFQEVFFDRFVTKVKEVEKYQ